MNENETIGIRQSAETKELFAALAEAASAARLVEMTGNNTFDRYKYAKLDDYVLAIRKILPAHKLAIISSVESVESLPNRTTKNGGVEYAARVRVSQRIVHSSGQWVETHSVGEGQDRADKAIYKAITGARKYGIAAALCLATGDDPESDENVGQTPAPKVQKKAGTALDTLKQPTNSPAQVRPAGVNEDGEFKELSPEEEAAASKLFLDQAEASGIDRGLADAYMQGASKTGEPGKLYSTDKRSFYRFLMDALDEGRVKTWTEKKAKQSKAA